MASLILAILINFMKKIILKHDLFNITNRLKQIDKNYFIVFNLITKKFEVHYKRKKDTFELLIPYEKLDSRTIDLVLKSKIENRKKIFKEIEENNRLLEEKNKEKILDEASFKAKEMIGYINSKGDNQNLNFDDAYKTKWI